MLRHGQGTGDAGGDEGGVSGGGAKGEGGSTGGCGGGRIGEGGLDGGAQLHSGATTPKSAHRLGQTSADMVDLSSIGDV